MNPLTSTPEAVDEMQTQDNEPQPSEAQPRSSRLAELAEAASLPLLLVAMAVFFLVLPASGESFGNVANFKIILADGAILLVVCLAILFPMVTNTWDFSPGASAGLCAIVAASVVNSSGSVTVALLAALATGAVIGAINGVLVTRLRVHSVIATLGMTIIIAGFVQWRTDGNALLRGIPQSVTNFGSDSFLAIPLLMWVGLLLAFVAFYILRRTIFGRDLHAIGSNLSAARLMGLRIERFVFVAYVIGGLLAACAGMLILARTGAGNPGVGPGYLLPAYAAVFLGATTITPGRWNVWGSLVAVLFLGALNSGLTLAGASSYVNSFANGLALFVGVGVANVLAHRRGRSPEMS
jgi:ribose transport system permease protein